MRERFTEWPNQVRFGGRELDVILAALDHAVELAPSRSPAFRAIRRAQMTIWRKLWPELADQYDDFGAEDQE